MTARCAACFEQCYSVDEPCTKCGYQEADNDQGDALPIGTLLGGRFLIGRCEQPKLPFGFHYRGWDREFDNDVVIFEYLPKDVAFRDDEGPGVHVRDDQAEVLFDTGLAGFESQLNILKHLSHPCLVKIRTLHKEHGTLYVVKEPVPGVSLVNVTAMRRLTEAAAIHMIMPMLAALSLAHKAELLHGNMVPEVLRVNRADQIVLDFFAAPFYQQARYRPALRSGFNATFLPDDLFDGELRVAGEVFNCGLLLAWLLQLSRADLQPAIAAEAPNEGGADDEAPPDPEAWLSSALLAVLRQAVDRDETLRFRNIDGLRAALSGVPSYREYLQLQSEAAPAPRRQVTVVEEPRGMPAWLASDWPWPAFGLGAMAAILGVWQNTPVLVGGGMGLMGVGGLGGAAMLVARRTGNWTTPAPSQRRIPPWRNEYFRLVAATKDGDDQGPIFSYLLQHFHKAESLGDLKNMQLLRDTYAQHSDGEDKNLAALDVALRRQAEEKAKLRDAEQAWGQAVKVKDFDEMGRLLRTYQKADTTLYEQRRRQFGKLTKGKKRYMCKKVKMAFCLIPAGSFLMGANDGEANERPVTPVTITQPFYLAKYPVTQAQWTLLMKSKPWAGKVGAVDNPNAPATHISHRQALAYALKLNAALGVNQYRLPTEAEWEYACRAGHSDAYYFGHGREKLGNYAWYLDNTLERGLTTAQTVGRKRNNVWGLYDMVGNVWEWCADSFWRYPGRAAKDPSGDLEGFEYMVRGGSYQNNGWECRVSVRGTNPADYVGPDQGFRLARNLT